MEKKGFLENIKEFYKYNKYAIFLLFGIVIIIVMMGLYNKYFKTMKTYTVINGFVEKTSDVAAYVANTETVVEINKSEVATPIIEQGKRVAKNDTIAVYKNTKYDEFLKEIDAMDKEIQTLVKDLPSVYSNDIVDIDNKIAKITAQAKEETSYVKIQQYKNQIDELAYKKINILGELSPAGSKIREIIQSRKELEAKKTTMADNIKAPTAGIVTYKLDGLETAIDSKKILEYDIQDFESMIKQYSANNQSNFGIKIVDNYSTYIVIKEQKSSNDEYIKEGKNYSLKLIDMNNEKLTATLVKDISNDYYHYLIFQIQNDVEKLVDARMINIEVIWTRISRVGSS